VVDLLTRLPIEVWFREQSRANDTTFMSNLLC
jgi:hypothetical protein